MSRAITLEVAENPTTTDTIQVTIDQFDIDEVLPGGDEGQWHVYVGDEVYNIYMEDQPVETENAINQFLDPM